MALKGDITCIGGLVVDHIMITNRLPDRGENYTANSYRKALGGKGGNSSIAVYRSCHKKPTAGAENGEETIALADGFDVDINPYLIGAVGKDDAGALYIQTLKDNGVDTKGIREVEGQPTGTGFVMVEEDTRDNWLLGVLGANESFTAEDFVPVEFLGNTPDLVVAQLEIGMKASEQMLETAGRAGIDILLNPSPANHILLELYPYITHFVVNETEAAIYSGLEIEDVKEDALHDIAKGFLNEGVKNVIITLGADGAFWANKEASGRTSAYKVTPIDSTGAGDTFTGAYASEIVRQKKMNEAENIGKAVDRACKAAALTICTLGAQEGIPWANEIEEFVVNTEAPTEVEEVITAQEGLAL